MKMVVAIKHVPDTETKVKIRADGTGLDPGAVGKWIVSPYDEYALEQALQVREASSGEVVLVCLGPPAAQPTIRQGLAMGADRAIHVQDERFERADGLTRARAIAAIVRTEAPDLVLLGKYGVGTDEALTGPMVAELLDWPHAAAVSSLTLDGDGGFAAERGVEGAVEVLRGTLPALVTCDKGLNDPRYPSLKGIMQAKKKPIETKTPQEVGVSEEELEHPRLVWEAMELPPPRGAGRILEGAAGEAARELARLLREEAKVI